MIYLVAKTKGRAINKSSSSGLAALQTFLTHLSSQFCDGFSASLQPGVGPPIAARRE